MCIRTAIKASVLCLIPGLVGFSAGWLSMHSPKSFFAVLFLVFGAIGYLGVMSYRKAGHGEKLIDCQEVGVAAGALFAISALFGFWTGLAAGAGVGLLYQGVLVSVGTALLAAFTLTFVRRVVDRKVQWLEPMMERIWPIEEARPQGQGKH